MPSIIRRIRTRAPTCLSVGFGAFLAIIIMISQHASNASKAHNSIARNARIIATVMRQQKSKRVNSRADLRVVTLSAIYPSLLVSSLEMLNFRARVKMPSCSIARLHTAHGNQFNAALVDDER